LVNILSSYIAIKHAETISAVLSCLVLQMLSKISTQNTVILKMERN